MVGGIMVYSAPDGAEIYIDGTQATYPSGEIIKTPAMIYDIPEGEHYITFILPGYIEKTKIVDVMYDQWTDVDAILHQIQTTPDLSPLQLLALQPAPGWPALPIPQIPYGHIVANTIPDGAEVYIDGQPVFDSLGLVATTPVTILGIPVGVHRVTFRKEGYFDENIDALIQNGLYSDASAVLRLHMATSSEYPYGYPATGDIYIDSSPQGAYIYIDGNSLIDIEGRAILTPVRVTGVSEGLHEVQISLDGYYSKKIFIRVIHNQVNDISVTLQSIY